eukprot:TRINITY_DN49349_c0_g1_i1.p1 TRINITY_DN49349_c0_g1~~TRINITY_DN49349_c0_g1_i1.p1  ORF type:complete len:440 (-),score=75.83 TRINITY_DN49349_c0_g1_i1:260-1579(-)
MASLSHAARTRLRHFQRVVRPLAVHSRRVAASYVPLPNELDNGATLRYARLGRAHVLGVDEERAPGLRIALVGASGSLGAQIARALVAKRRDFAGQGSLTVQFVGARDGNSLATLMGLCSELRDAYDEFCPNLEIVLDLEAAQADVIVMAAGAVLSSACPTHADLVNLNADIFGHYASGLVERNSRAIVLVVSNPVEFGVDTFVSAGFRSSHVIGTGAYLDSLRFRREIASELGVPRQHVSGLVLGVHGLGMVPCWSTVRLAGFASAEKEEQLEKMKTEGLSRMPKDTDSVRSLAYEVRALAEKGNALAASSLVNQQPADIRAAVRRYLSFFSGLHFPREGVAVSVCRILSEITNGSETKGAAQVHVEPGSNFLGVEGHAIGAPVVVSGHGVKLAPLELMASEEEALIKAAKEASDLSMTAKAKTLFTMIKRRAASRAS